MRNLILLPWVLLPVLAAEASAATVLRPAAVNAFFTTSGQPAVLPWKAEGDRLTEPTDYIVRDYQQRQVSAGKAQLTPDGLQATVQLGPGFFDIELPALGQRFGIISLVPFQGQVDPFFAIDAAMSWLVHGDAAQDGLAKALRRCGIGMARERLSWPQIQSAADQWQWDAGGYDRLRRAYARHGVQVLEMFHDAPDWLGHVGKYPDDLVAAKRAWQAIGGRWRPTWGALELWNEPDIIFSDYLPADQYVALAKAVAYGLRHSQPDLPLVGGVVALSNRPYLDNAARNGLLECVDIFSFHTYSRAEQMEGLVAQYRDWLKTFDHEGMPLWLTECGRPWKKGPPRPPADQDAASALDITMKAVEARACGIARYFPFVYPFYEENDNNFGMMGSEITPLRSMAAFAQSAARLAGTRYLGDLTDCDPAVKRARVFGDGRQIVIVLYTGTVRADAKVPFHLPVLRAEGIDGRPLPTGDGQSLPIPDGLSYVLVEHNRLQSRLATDTAAMRMTRQSAVKAKPAEPQLPIVLRYQFDPAIVRAKTQGYHVGTAPVAKFPFRVRAFNLSDQPQALKVGLAVSPADAAASIPAEQAVTAPPQGFVDIAWTLDLSQAWSKTERLQLTAHAQGPTAGRPVPLAVDLMGEPTLDQWLARFSRQGRLAIADRNAWRPKIAANGQIAIDITPDGSWRLTARFAPGDRWVYPELTLPADVDVGQFEGLLIRARCLKPGRVRVMLWEGETGVRYLNAREIIPDDGQWHTAFVRFSELVWSSVGAPDPNERLDLDQVRRISVGLNSETEDCALEVSSLHLVGQNVERSGARTQH